MFSIQLQQVGHRFGSKTLFADKSAVFKTGITGVSGPNGAGKSTFLQICAGLLTPSFGNVTWNREKELDRYEIRPHLGFCAPALSLYEDLTVQENLDFLFNIRGLSPEKLPVSLSDWNLSELAALPLKKLSSGQQQRVKLAAAFHPDATFIVLDEPSSNLDLTNRMLLYSQIERFSVSATLLVASNEADDLQFATQMLSIP